MHLYTYVSITVVVIATATLHLILKKNKSKDRRYTIGLGISAIVAVIASLLLPDIVAAFTADLAMHLALSFFIAFLIYITLLFFTMMLVAAAFPQKKMDKLNKKWEDNRLKRQEAKEFKLKQKENAAKAELEEVKIDTESPQETIFCESKTEASESGRHQEQILPELKSESILKNIFINRFSHQKVKEIMGEPTLEELEDSLENITFGEEMSETTDAVNDEQADERVPVIKNEQALTDDEPEGIFEIEQSTDEKLNIVDTGILEYVDAIANEPEDIAVPSQVDDKPLKADDTEPLAQEDIFGETAILLGQNSEYDLNIEKNVDTSDIIDKMGVDEIPKDNVPYLDFKGLSLNEIIDKAFLLKQDGREIEAASLYIEALDRSPDNEAAFLIILDICTIYKNAGQSELAEDILLTYIDEFEHLMSTEIKDQVLQELYS